MSALRPLSIVSMCEVSINRDFGPCRLNSIHELELTGMTKTFLSTFEVLTKSEFQPYKHQPYKTSTTLHQLHI